MMNFSVYENGVWTPVRVEINPTLVKAQDTTNDSFSCTLAATTREKPYAPMTPFKITYDDETEEIMWINNDSVALFSLKPAAWKHSLSLVQFRYYLNKHLLRTTRFNQPRQNIVTLYGAITNWYYNETTYGITYHVSADNTTIGFPEYWSDYIHFNSHARIKSMSINLKMFAAVRDSGGTVTLQELTSINPHFNARIKEKAVFIVIDTNNNNYEVTDPIYIEDFGTEINVEPYLSDIEDYIAGNSNIQLALKYTVLDTIQGRRESAFLETISQDLEDEPNTNYRAMTCQIELKFELYYYTMYDVIQTMLKQHRLVHDGVAYKRQQLFNLPTENSTGKDKELYDLLTSTYPPDTMAFTQATFYEVLTEIFRFYDAGFKFDENRTLQIEYYNELSREIELKRTGSSLSHSDKNYNNGRDAFYQNALAKVELRRMNTRSKDLGVPSESGYGIILPKPIYMLQSMKLRCSGDISLDCLGETSSTTVAVTVLDSVFLDITPFCLNKDYWSTLPATKYIGGSYTSVEYQTTRMFYERGGTFINVSDYAVEYQGTQKHMLDSIKRCAFARFFGMTRHINDVGTNFPNPRYDDYLNQFFDIEYLTMNNGRFEIQTIESKYNGTQIVNQSNGGVDLSKYGLSIFAESLKDGEPSLTASWEIKEWSQRIKEGDYFIDSSGAYWVANIINYTPLVNGNQQCTVEFTKNFNALALRVQSDSLKRLTNISDEIADMSEDVYVDYWYVSDSPFTEDGETHPISASVLRTNLLKTFNYANENYGFDTITLVAIHTYDEREYSLASYIEIPLIKYGAGNCICFEMQYNHPNSAGNQLIPKESGSWYSTSYFSKACLYTDEEGWADKITIVFLEHTRNYVASYPVIGSPTTERGRINKLEYYKKPNEIFGLTYEWCFLPKPSEINKFFIGNKFITENSLVNLEKARNKKFYLRYCPVTSDYRYSIMDLKAGEDAGIKVPLTISATYSSQSHIITVTIANDVGIINAKSWSIIDQENNIYFASNNPKVMSINSTLLYFLSKINRI